MSDAKFRELTKILYAVIHMPDHEWYKLLNAILRESK